MSTLVQVFSILFYEVGVGGRDGGGVGKGRDVKTDSYWLLLPS